MAEQMYITPSNDNRKSHIRDTRYISNNDQLSDNIKKMMDLDIIRDLAMRTMAEDSTISYDLAFKIARAEYYGEEIEIPIPPIEIEEEELVNDTKEDVVSDEKVNMDTIGEIEIPVTENEEIVVEPEVESLEDISVPTVQEEEIELPKLDNFEELIIPEVNLDTDIELPTEELFSNEVEQTDITETDNRPVETLDKIDNLEELNVEDIAVPFVEDKQEEQIENSTQLMEPDDQLLDNLLDMDVTNNFSELDSILLNNEEVFTTEPITQKTK